MEIREYRRDGFLIPTDKPRLDLQAIHGFPSRESYWAVGRPLETTPRSIETSLCFGLYDPQGLYRRHGGFTPPGSPERWMERVRQPS